MNKILFIIISFFCVIEVNAQELNARVTVSASQVTNNVNRSAFQTLQTALNNFLNTRKWTKDAYAQNEKIDRPLFKSSVLPEWLLDSCTVFRQAKDSD